MHLTNVQSGNLACIGVLGYSFFNSRDNCKSRPSHARDIGGFCSLSGVKYTVVRLLCTLPPPLAIILSVLKWLQRVLTNTALPLVSLLLYIPARTSDTLLLFPRARFPRTFTLDLTSLFISARSITSCLLPHTVPRLFISICILLYAPSFSICRQLPPLYRTP